MTISTGERLPEANLMRMGAEGPEEVSLGDLTAGRKVVIFAVPGAYTPTCHSAHVPSFIRNMGALGEKGVDEVVCVSVNDPFVMQAWGEATGANEAGITMLADPMGEFTRAIGMDFDLPQAGLMGRSLRYAMLVEDGEVTVQNLEDDAGQCSVSAGEAMLEAMN